MRVVVGEVWVAPCGSKLIWLEEVTPFQPITTDHYAVFDRDQRQIPQGQPLPEAFFESHPFGFVLPRKGLMIKRPGEVERRVTELVEKGLPELLHKIKSSLPHEKS